jgi:hypothetical protein
MITKFVDHFERMKAFPSNNVWVLSIYEQAKFICMRIRIVWCIQDIFVNPILGNNKNPASF